MTEIEYEGRSYSFSWFWIIVFVPLIYLTFLFLMYIADLYWLYTHEPVLAQTVWATNLITRMNLQYELVSIGGEPSFFQYIVPGRGPIGFETYCTGLQATAIFAGVIIFVPHSKGNVFNQYKWGPKLQVYIPIGNNKFHIDFHMWLRKAWSLALSAVLFHVVNILRMVLQLYMYYVGFAWNDIHVPIGAASSFIAAIIILLMHRWLPEFVLSLMWVSGDIRRMIVQFRERRMEESKMIEEAKQPKNENDI